MSARTYVRWADVLEFFSKRSESAAKSGDHKTEAKYLRVFQELLLYLHDKRHGKRHG